MSIVTNCLFFLLMFPWVSLGLNNMDSQPFPLIFGSILIVFYALRREGFRVQLNGVIAAVLFFSLPLSLVTKFSFDEVRLVVSLLTVLVCFSLGSFLSRSNEPLFIKILMFTNFTYIFFGVIQLAFGPNSLSLFVNLRTSSTRGLTSLTPEPGFFGLTLAVFSVVWFRCMFSEFGSYKKYVRAILIANIACILFLAKSATATLALFSALFVMYALIVKPSLKSAVKFMALVVVSVGVGYFVISSNLGRISNVLGDLWSDPGALLLDDKSVAVRFVHVVGAFLISFDNFFMPIAIDQVADARNVVMNSYLSDIYFESDSNKTSSYIGAFVQLFGWVGVFILLLIYNKKTDVVMLLGLFIVGLFSVPIACSFFAVLLGYAFRGRTVYV